MPNAYKRFDFNAAKLPFLILAVSILVTVGVSYNFYQTARSKDVTRFNNEVSRIQSAVQNKINLYVALLKGGRGFIESTDQLNRQTFANYINSLQLEVNYAGVQGIGYSMIFQPNERQKLLTRMTSEGYSDFRLFPETDQSSHQAIIYIEPASERNRKVLGFDMSSEENRREALIRARDTGQPAASSKVTLIQEDDADKKAGFLIYLPVYKRGTQPSSVEDRRRNLIGYIYSPFRARAFLDEIQQYSSPNDVEIKIYDGESRPENLLAQTAPQESKTFAEQIEEKYANTETLNVAGRNWTISYSSLPGFVVQSNVGWTPLIFISGLVFSCLMFGFTYWEASTRAEMQVTAAELFKLEQQKQGLLEQEQKARQIAERASKTKDEFIAVVSHELRTPLNAIAGWIKILKTESLSGNTKTMALEKIDKNLRLQTRLVEELLDYSQIITEGIVVENKKFVFSEVFENTFEQIRERARTKHIEFIKENRLNGHQIAGDKDKIKIVVRNLLSNAVKFTDEGGRVEASVMENNGTIHLIVKDTGKGIDPDFLPHIFERFRQDDNTITRAYGGLGLGLAISSHIVRLHDGIIEAHSEGIGKGSTFTVKLPSFKV